jgi:hypothetical protein
MSSNKCKECGIVNAAYDRQCRRCGFVLHTTNLQKGGAGKVSSLFYTLLALSLVAGAAYYLVQGFEKSYDRVKETEAKRLAAQPKVSPALTSRADSDARRAEAYKNAVANSPNLSASQKHNNNVKQLIEPAR